MSSFIFRVSSTGPPCIFAYFVGVGWPAKLPILNLHYRAKRRSFRRDIKRGDANSFSGETIWFLGETNRGEINGDYV